jgi:VWFA-related protein
MLGGWAAGQSTAPPERGVTIRTTVNEVVLDLVVRDKHRRLVKNLKPGDVEIYEDGVRQQIIGFRLTGTTAAPEERAAEKKKTEEASIAPRKVKPASRPLRALNVVCIVFHNLNPYTRQYAVEAAEEFLNNDLEPGTWVGMFSLGDRLTVLHQFTTSVSELIQAARNVFTVPASDFTDTAQAVLSAEPIMVTVSVSGDMHAGQVTTDLSITGGELNTQAIGGADVSTGAGANMRRGDLAAQRRQFGDIEGMRETDQVMTMIEQLKQLPGHKTVLLFSPGLATTGDPDRFERILHRANQADISIYSIDINGLTQNSNVLASTAALNHTAALSRSQARASDGPAAMMEKMRQGEYLQEAVRTSGTQASLGALSEGTGGFLIANTNDLRKAFRRVAEDVDTHYEAVYHPASNKYDGHFRKIEVRLARPDLTVETRTGYFAMPDLRDSGPLTPSEVFGLVALNAQPRPHAFEFRSGTFDFPREDANSQQAVAFEVPVASLTATPQPEQKKHRLHVSLLALVKNASGEIVDKFSQNSLYEVPDEKLAALQTDLATYTHVFDLPPGRYTLETAVLDQEGRRAATNTLQFGTSARKGLGLSSVMLVRQIERINGQPDPANPFEFAESRVVPELATALSPGAEPYAYFVVYPDAKNRAKPRIEVQFLLNGRVLARRVAALPPPDASGAIPMVIESAARPGNCELKITALQGDESAAQSVQFSIAAKQAAGQTPTSYGASPR